jgi:L-alanine-DL-glutamate epimerase-like enolase superfamily enzyme
MYGISAVDVALWDILGKCAGVPLVDLLGGPFAPEVEVYASLLPYGAAEAVAAATRKAIDLGYRYVKLHETTLSEVQAAVEEAGTEAVIMLDVNCPWSVGEALEMDRKLAPFGLFWLEEPVWPPENYRGLARVRAEKRHRIAAGENAGSVHDIAAMIDAGAIDIAQPDVAKTGGITELMKIAALCEACAIGFMPHCAMFGPGQVATLHINAAQRSIPLFERFFCDFGTELLFGEAMIPKRGMLQVPTGPGLGIEPDQNVINKYRVA